MNQADLYRAVWRNPEYCRGTTRADPVLPRIIASEPHNLLDIGCGRNEVVHHLRDHGITALGLDIALPHPSPAWAIEGHLLDVVDFIGGIEVVTAFDVLEHLSETDLVLHLDAMAQMADRAVFAIANMTDVHQVDGIGPVDLHLIQQPWQWWADRIQRTTYWECMPITLDYPERFFLLCGDWS